MVKSEAQVKQSGNSDVSVSVTIDLAPLAIVLASLLHAEGKLSTMQYKELINKIETPKSCLDHSWI